MKKSVALAMLLIAVFLVSDRATGGTLVGEAKFVGEVPKAEVLKADKDVHCIEAFESRPSEQLIVSEEKGIKNIVVSVEGVEGAFEPSEESLVLDQVKCIYTPHVLPLLIGTVVLVRNSDPVNHNVRSNAEENEPINWAMPEQDMELPLFLEEPEIVKLTCDIHKWMSAYLVVKENPYFAVTDGKGAFQIAHVPAGTYTVQVWHEKLGVQTQQVKVPETGEVKITFRFSLQKEKE